MSGSIKSLKIVVEDTVFKFIASMIVQIKTQRVLLCFFFFLLQTNIDPKYRFSV